MESQFSEATFAFCVNHELVDIILSNGFLVTPILPSTRKEKKLAYDIQLKISRGSFKRSLFLQHKVPHFVQNRSWNNNQMYMCHRGPFYWFNVRNTPKSRQHNRLVTLAKRWGAVYYCAPLFHRIWEMEHSFTNRTVTDMSRFFYPLQMGPIGPLEQHQVSYNALGTIGYFHTEPHRIAVMKLLDLLAESKASIGEKYYSKLLDVVVRVLEETGTKWVAIPKNLEEFGDAITASYLLRKHFNLTWILLNSLREGGT